MVTESLKNRTVLRLSDGLERLVITLLAGKRAVHVARLRHDVIVTVGPHYLTSPIATVNKLDFHNSVHFPLLKPFSPHYLAVDS